MPVSLRWRVGTVLPDKYERLICIPGGQGKYANREITYITGQLESAFDGVAPEWLKTAQKLNEDDSALLAHTPACAANASDFGEMLAWSTLIEKYAQEPVSTLLICADPWLYRYFLTLGQIDSEPPPPITLSSLKFWIRGYAARLKAAAVLLFVYLTFRHQRSRYKKAAKVLMVYGHPSSTVGGYDGYFGDLISRYPEFQRLLHVDCGLNRARELCRDGGSVSLHAWGSLSDLMALPFAKWRPSQKHTQGRYGWLVKRAAAMEGATGQGAMIAWQKRCQSRWLRRCRPNVVSWPWENHAWERMFVSDAQKYGVRTIGYQHSVIGSQMLNYSPGSFPESWNVLPDRLLCTGAAMVAQLKKWGISSDRLIVGGAWRFRQVTADNWDSGGPVYMALPFDPDTSAEMIRAARNLATHGVNIFVKAHPMTPYRFTESDGLVSTHRQFYEEESVSVVVYAASAVGLEAALAGLPTVRFRPTNRISIDILPVGITLPTAGVSDLKDVLTEDRSPIQFQRDQILATVDLSVWRREFELGDPHEHS